MENASKALIMAATVLLGVMIMSIGVALFNTFSSFSADTAKKMEEKQIAEWNNTYLKYYGEVTNDDGKKEPIKVTAHDIVSIINSARENNINYFQDENDLGKKYAGKENYYYVQVLITGKNAETWKEEQKLKFLKENSLTNENETINFKCTDVKVSSVTKRVYSISFEKVN